MPSHFHRICLAIDQLPADLNFDDPSLPATGQSQQFEILHLSQSDADFDSMSAEEDGQSFAKQKIVPPQHLIYGPRDS